LACSSFFSLPDPPAHEVGRPFHFTLLSPLPILYPVSQEFFRPFSSSTCVRVESHYTEGSCFFFFFLRSPPPPLSKIVPFDFFSSLLPLHPGKVWRRSVSFLTSPTPNYTTAYGFSPFSWTRCLIPPDSAYCSWAVSSTPRHDSPSVPSFWLHLGAAPCFFFPPPVSDLALPGALDISPLSFFGRFSSYDNGCLHCLGVYATRGGSSRFLTK